ncbi:hypothetical protein JF544_01715 [Halobacillus kuroshimensis]|uniref:Uncharacterized protein n=1 Tax=Halobacillus kuroshimensis TaxID=302481 RepID=A0ABS3DRH1_9BACI|nr:MULTISPECIES: hypothetical protein [Halobacillus]MBN8233937.1 hypothetical protein [Halobacillus kuroshimensis]
MLMQVFFMFAALSIPVSILFDKEAVGVLASLFFMLVAAFFSKPRFSK